MARKSKLNPPQGQLNPPSEDLDFLDNLLEDRNKAAIVEGMELHEPSTLEDGGEAAWLRLQGATPLEFLAMVYKNPWNSMNERISAAKSILEFVHRRLPHKIEVEGTVRDTRKITPEALAKLSDEELSAFTTLLEKLEG